MQETKLQNAIASSQNFLIDSSRVVKECNPNMDEMVFINSLTINAFCLLGNLASGYLANRVGRQAIPGKLKNAQIGIN